MRYVGVFNRDGGTFKTIDMDAFCTQAQQIFLHHGHGLDCTVVDGPEIVSALEAAVRRPDIDVLLAGGGDGTVSAAADIAFRQGVPLAVLPAGTMNLFARSLQVPLGLADALEALASGQVAAVDIATANGKPFVHHFGVGIHARLVRIRDSLTYNSRLGKMLASLRALLTAIMHPPRFEAEIRTRRGVERRVTSGITISNNPVGEGHVPHADSLDQGVLGVYVARPLSEWALARLFVQVLAGHWKDNPQVSEKEVQELTLRFPRKHRQAQAVLDGELIALEDKVVLKIHPGGLRVIAPA